MVEGNAIVGKIEREKGYLYYIDEEGNIWKAPLKRGGRKKKSDKEKKP